MKDLSIVVLDACMLYPAPLRDLLLWLACEGLYQARWTDEIHDEWIRNLLANRPDLTNAQLQRTRNLMNRAVPSGLTTGHSMIISTLTLPDPSDRHVLAAAIRAKAEIILTFNEKDFPAETLDEFDICTLHPDEFIVRLISLDRISVCRALKSQRLALKNPPVTAEELLGTLEVQRLPVSVSQLRPLLDYI